jgi:hypothetical protein
MTRLLRSGRILSAFTLAALASVALPSASALGQPVKDKTGTGATEAPATPDATTGTTAAPAGETQFTVTVGEVVSEGSNVDDATLQAILEGDFVDYADELASLEATSITVPELRVDFQVPVATGGTEGGSFTYHDLQFSDVSDGVAGSVSIGSGTSEMNNNMSVEFGAMSASEFNIGQLLAFYGLVPSAGGEELAVLYRDFELEGGSFTWPMGSCTFGTVTGGEFKARPLTMPFGEVMALATRIEAQGDNPSPQDLAQLLNFYGDMLTAFETSEVRLDGADCSGTTDDGSPLEIALGAVILGAWADGRYPDISVSGFSLSDGDGIVALAEATFKGFELLPVVQELQAVGEDISDAWVQENYRKLIPPFEGFSFSGLSVDVPNPDATAGRISFTIGDADLTLRDYVNGIPTAISSHLTNFGFDIPRNSGDDTAEQLLALGIETLDVGYDLALSWDPDAQNISLDKLEVNGADLGSVELTALLGNATEALFSDDTNAAMAAAMMLTAKSVSVSIYNGGIVDLILDATAQEQGTTADTLRQQVSGVAQGTILALLGGSANVQQVSQSVGDLINGAANFTLTITSKAETGITVQELAAAQSGNPTVLLNSLNFEASSSE